MKLTAALINRVMTVCMVLGIMLLILGVCLAVFTNISVTMGADGVLLIALIIGIGLLLLIPSKIYLTLLFFQKGSK
ncbi:hypothetical protein [Psychromonas ossibalaenae]|uniref:hypothetical protein n=1 Tax=Psychromonas ossibalaenae TaxID=444922 RepID=UPI00037F76AD|nr:hypothetical protein [Psychromonas ossibalaenae]